MGATQEKMAIKKNSVNIIIDAIKVENESMMFYIAAKRYDPEGQEANTNMPQENKYENCIKEEWQNILGLPSEMDITVMQRYSHLRETLLRITYNSLRVKLTGTLKFCDKCARCKAKLSVIRKKTYTKLSKPGEKIFVDTTSPFLDILLEIRTGLAY